MDYIYPLLAGFFITNGVPHFIKGITGQTHMTPFLRVSPAWLNIVWAFVNFVIGLWILKVSGMKFGELTSFNTHSIAFLIGVFAMGLSAAWLFSKPNARLPWHKD